MSAGGFGMLRNAADVNGSYQETEKHPSRQIFHRANKELTRKFLLQNCSEWSQTAKVLLCDVLNVCIHPLLKIDPTLSWAF